MAPLVAVIVLAVARSFDAATWAAPAQGSKPVSADTIREVAVTFDDLPAVSVAKGDPTSLALFTDRLLANFSANKVPIVGFVNQIKMTLPGETLGVQAARIDLLNKWLDQGIELGNHTYSHRSLNQLPIEEFEADVVRGESAMSALMVSRKQTLRYFRHPFLQVGLDFNKRQAFEAWLKARGYTVAPVTMDNDEYIFAAVYANAVKANDTVHAGRTAEAYLTYMAKTFDFQEDLSQSLFGRPIRHVLLLHANELNADHVGKLFAMMRQRGYQFVTLARALEDAAYQSPDTYVGGFGISWLHHWELTMGRRRTGSPDPPAWITEAYEKSRP